jgi:hypothetical protein
MCGKFMMIVNVKNKKGRTYVCSDLKCRHEETEHQENIKDFRRSRKESQMNKRLISKYSDHKKKPGGVTTLGDLFEAALDKKE